MATPEQYRDTFALDQSGRDVLDDLIDRFAKAPFVPGAPDVTAYNCGTKAVLEHVLAMIDAAGKLPR